MRSNLMSFQNFKTKGSLLLLTILFLSTPLLASSAGLGLIDDTKKDQKIANDAFQANAGFDAATSGTTLPTAVGLVIRVFIGLLGTIFLILILTAGWNWFTAQGDSKKIETAKAKMINAVIGLVIVVSAYAITVFVFRTAGDLGVMGGGSTANLTSP